MRSSPVFIVSCFLQISDKSNIKANPSAYVGQNHQLLYQQYNDSTTYNNFHPLSPNLGVYFNYFPQLQFVQEKKNSKKKEKLNLNF